MNLPFAERQCLASACLRSDPLLLTWDKSPAPLIDRPPENVGKLLGFRDPFICEEPK